jgi:hypothetical protein
MIPLGLSANRLAQALAVPANRVTAILNGTRAITADTATRLALCFDTTPASGSTCRTCTTWIWSSGSRVLRSPERCDRSAATPEPGLAIAPPAL